MVPELFHFLQTGSSEGENINVRSDTAERWEQEQLSPREIHPPLKESDKRSVYLRCVFNTCVCFWERDFDKSLCAVWDLCLCYSDNGVLCFSLHFPLSLWFSIMYISAFSSSLPLPLLVFISLRSPVSVSSFTLWIWCLSRRRWVEERESENINKRGRRLC